MLQAIILGIVQGLTEFLPISSTGHLRIVPAFAGWDDPGAGFTAVVQLGTTAAVLIYFREDLLRVATAWFASLRDPTRRAELDARLGWYLIIATIPIGLIGLVLHNSIESGARSLYLIGSALILFSFVMLAAEYYGKQDRKLETFGMRDAIAIGIGQALALVPGVSRSGATISTGLFCGFERADAARFSFLLSIPAIVLAALFELRGVVTGDNTVHAAAGPVIISIVFAFIFGYLSIAWLLRFVAHHSLGVFVGYRIIIGSLVLILAASGAIS